MHFRAFRKVLLLGIWRLAERPEELDKNLVSSRKLRGRKKEFYEWLDSQRRRRLNRFGRSQCLKISFFTSGQKSAKACPAMRFVTPQMQRTAALLAPLSLSARQVFDRKL